MEYLTCKVRGGKITEIANKNFTFNDREWTVEPASRTRRVLLYSVRKYEGKLRLLSWSAWRLFAAWEEKQAYPFSELRIELLNRPRKTRPVRKNKKDDYKRVIAVRKALSEREREKLDLMAPGEKQEFYYSHKAWREGLPTEKGERDD